MAELVDPAPSSDVVVGFDSKMMRNNLKLCERDLKGMHLVSKCVGGLNCKAISQFQKVLYIEGILGLSL